MRGTVTRSRASLNRGLHVELQETKGKKNHRKISTAAGDSFQTGQTAKALQGYRVQSLPRRTPASGFAVNVDNIHITSSIESSEDRRPGDFFLNPLNPYRTSPNKVTAYCDVLIVRNRALGHSVFRV